MPGRGTGSKLVSHSTVRSSPCSAMRARLPPASTGFTRIPARHASGRDSSRDTLHCPSPAMSHLVRQAPRMQHQRLQHLQARESAFGGRAPLALHVRERPVLVADLAAALRGGLVRRARRRHGHRRRHPPARSRQETPGQGSVCIELVQSKQKTAERRDAPSTQCLTTYSNREQAFFLFQCSYYEVWALSCTRRCDCLIELLAANSRLTTHDTRLQARRAAAGPRAWARPRP